MDYIIGLDTMLILFNTFQAEVQADHYTLAEILHSLLMIAAPVVHWQRRPQVTSRSHERYLRHVGCNPGREPQVVVRITPSKDGARRGKMLVHSRHNIPNGRQSRVYLTATFCTSPKRTLPLSLRARGLTGVFPGNLDARKMTWLGLPSCILRISSLMFEAGTCSLGTISYELPFRVEQGICIEPSFQSKEISILPR
jgi:hypothetical protein